MMLNARFRRIRFNAPPRRPAEQRSLVVIAALGFAGALATGASAEPMPPATTPASGDDSQTPAPPPEVEFQDVPVEPEHPAAPPVTSTTTTSVPVPAPRATVPGQQAPQAPTSAPASAARPFPNVFPVFRQHVEQARGERIGGSLAKLLIGGVAIPLGVVAESEWGNAYAQIIWIGGVGSVVSGVLGLAFSSPFERMADTFRLDANKNPTPREEARLMRAWGGVAESARSNRVSSAWVGLVVGAVAAGAGGVIIGTDIGDLDPQTREDWATALILVGAFSIGDSISDFFIQTPVERSYHAYKASVRGEAQPSSMPVELGFLPLPAGGGVTVRSAF